MTLTICFSARIKEDSETGHFDYSTERKNSPSKMLPEVSYFLIIIFNIIFNLEILSIVNRE